MQLQKRLAAKVANCSRKRVRIQPDRIDDLKDAITKADVRRLISSGAIAVVRKRGVSRHRARKRHEQRLKGRQRGHGRRKGPDTSRAPRKKAWIARIRAQRDILSTLREKEVIAQDVYRSLYMKAKGGFFRSRRHISLYLKEHNLVKK